jgi:Protein of unknown function (DUF3617)
MTRIPSLALALTALAACTQPQNQQQQASVADQNDARADAVGAQADPNMLVAGRWETKTAIGSVSNSGLTEQGKREVAAQESALDQCLEPDEVRRPDANFFAGGDTSECEYTKFAMANGKLDAVMSCTATPGTITMTLSGRYTPTRYSLSASATTGGTPDAPMTTTAKLNGTWLGPCGDPDRQRAPEDPAR